MNIVHIALLFATTPVILGQTHFTPTSPVPPESVVLWGDARFSFLSETLIRLELTSRAGAFDDRQTLAVVNRSGFSPPLLSINTSGNVLTVRTPALTLSYRSPSGNHSSPVNSSCGLATGADAAGSFSRVPEYPLGAVTRSVAGCCALCDGVAACNAWVFCPPGEDCRGADPPGTNCWLLAGVTQLAPSAHRIAALIPPFANADLNVSFLVAGSPVTWTPQLSSGADAGNLRGAWHANDCYDKVQSCIQGYKDALAPGLLSTSGWAVLDDTNAARLVPPSPGATPLGFWYENATAATQPRADVYLFAGGLDFKAALRDYGVLGGPVALAPRSVYGVWWSHWAPYSQADVTYDILGGYRNFSLPLDHLMLDVDWHTESNGNSSIPCYGYGGWTVNTKLWPDWAGFISTLKNGSNPTGNKLRLMLNLHPSGGFDACQKYWDDFSAATGWTNKSRIMPCTYGNQTVAAATFSAYMDRGELAGVDGWWTDYSGDDCFDTPSGGSSSSWPGIAWSNEVFAGHAALRSGSAGGRPLVLSRSGGLGGHRNPVSFSGDVSQHRDILRYEIATTPSSANILYNHWSHDIGGFMCELDQLNQSDCSGDPSLPSNGLLYLRWIQAGATFPVLRTHASTWGLPVMERRVWKFPQYTVYMSDALRLRSTLLPYIYSSAADAALLTSVATMRPLYIDWPLEPDAFTAGEAFAEYLFGPSLLASPVWETNASTVVGGVEGGWKSTWLPPLQQQQRWCTFNASECLDGGAAVTRFYPLSDTPLFAKSGAIVPMQTLASVGEPTPDPLVVTVFPFAPGQTAPTSFSLYEDAGEGGGYRAGEFWRVPLSATRSGSLTVGAAAGGWTGAPAERGLEVRWRGVGAARGVRSVAVNGGAPLPTGAPGCSGCWWLVPPAQHTLAAPEGTLVVAAPGKYSTSSSTTIEVLLDYGVETNGSV